MTLEAIPIGQTERKEAASEAWWFSATAPLLAASIAFDWTLNAGLERLYGMTSYAWDLAYDQQVIWNISVGQGFYSSFARANFLGIHLEPIFVVLAAVEKFWPNPAVLLIFSSAGLAATAPAAYLFFRAILPERPESRLLAVALSLPIPFWVAIQEAARDFFHPENMALAFSLLAAWAGIRGHRIAMWLLCVLTLMCKEDQVYTVGVLGILMSAYGAPEVKKQWRFIVYLAAAWFLVGTGIVQQHVRNGGYTDFVYYAWLGGLNPSVPVSAQAILEAIFRPGALVIVGGIVASLFAFPLLAPRWLLLVIPPYLANVLSAHDPQNLLHFHYVLLLLFPMIVSGGVGARNYLKTHSVRPTWAALGVMLPALILGWATGVIPPGLNTSSGPYSRPNSVAELMTATSMIPATSSVSADSGLAVWLANRHTINDFPDKLEPTAYVVIDHDAFISGPTNRAQRQAALDALPTSDRRLLFDDGRFQVWSPIGD
jgi:uncharacterized membrane protein